MYTHILISTDGSELAKNGVNHGLSLAKALGGKITIVTVTAPFPVPPVGAGGWATGSMDLDLFESGNKEHAKTILSAAKATAERMALTVETLHIPNAWPAAAIVEAAKTRSCNLIVMASHGYRGIKRVLLGSQTAEVLATAHIPVLVIR